MIYEKLDKTQQENMLNQRIMQYEQEHFNHTINLKLLEASGITDEGTLKAIEDAKSAMATLDKAHANAKAEKASISSPATK